MSDLDTTITLHTVHVDNEFVPKRLRTGEPITVTGSYYARKYLEHRANDPIAMFVDGSVCQKAAAVSVVAPELQLTATARVNTESAPMAEKLAERLARAVARVFDFDPLIHTDSQAVIDHANDEQLPSLRKIKGHTGRSELGAHTLADKLAGTLRRHLIDDDQLNYGIEWRRGLRHHLYSPHLDTWWHEPFAPPCGFATRSVGKQVPGVPLRAWIHLGQLDPGKVGQQAIYRLRKSKSRLIAPALDPRPGGPDAERTQITGAVVHATGTIQKRTVPLHKVTGVEYV